MKNAAVLKKTRKRKKSPIVLQHYYTSEDFGGHPKGITSRVVHYAKLDVIESLNFPYIANVRFNLRIS